MPDLNPVDRYAFTSQLNADQWAWEFLRRNPIYRQEWLAFIETWQALIACYGKPAQRDMRAWNRDPRAWVPAASCEQSDCRVDGDKVLIECALGARWGFYKFPPDPSDDDPVGGQRLVWRPVTFDPPVLESAEVVRDSNRFTALVFDLELPLAVQLEQAKRHLQIEQRQRILAGRIKKPRISEHRDRLTRNLRLLDGLESNATRDELCVLLDLSERDFAQALEESLGLRDKDYRQLLLMR